MAENAARPAADTDVAAVADTLPDAFSGDPAFRWTARFDGELRSRLRPMFTSMTGQRMKLDEPLVYVAADDDA